MRLQKIILLILFGAIIVRVFLLLNHLAFENDEGIYWTTFLLVSKGFPLYQQTFFSQLPGFFLLVYPLFMHLGKTLIAARLAVLLWSLISILGIVWIAYELKNAWVAILALGLLLLDHVFILQMVTLQSDMLTLPFSTLAVAMLIRFSRGKQKKWLIGSITSFSIALWTKLDVSTAIILVPVIYDALKKRIITVKTILSLMLVFGSVSVMMLLPFNPPVVISQVFGLRSLAYQAYPFSVSKIVQVFIGNPFYSFITVMGVIFSAYLLGKKGAYRFIGAWSISSFLLILLRRPLFAHHLTLLTIPFVLVISIVFVNYVVKFWQRYIAIISVIFLGIIFFVHFIIMQYPSDGVLDTKHAEVVDLIQTNTKVEDVIISDEAIFYGASGRLPPPTFSDMSSVRIKSGTITAAILQEAIAIYKPRLIIAWNGRLRSIRGSDKLLNDYRLLAQYKGDKKIYIRK